MLKIRLKRVGRKHDPSFRLVVVESTRGPKSGDYIENLGSYDARANSKNINTERVSHWLSVGARPSETAHNLLVDAGIIDGKKLNVLPKKSPIKKEGDGTEETAENPAEKAPAESAADAAAEVVAEATEAPEEEPAAE